MNEAPVPRKSPYAVPYDRFVGEARGDPAELVVQQPHEASHDVPAMGDSGEGD